eukprot:COSAG04_NODE_6427_length_1328_cov_0.995118_1_plen_91_part_10
MFRRTLTSTSAASWRTTTERLQRQPDAEPTAKRPITTACNQDARRKGASAHSIRQIGLHDVGWCLILELAHRLSQKRLQADQKFGLGPLSG